MQRDGAASGGDSEAGDERRIEVGWPRGGECLAGAEPVVEQAGLDEEDGIIFLEPRAEHRGLARCRVANKQHLAAGIPFEREAEGRSGQPGDVVGEGDKLARAQVREIGHGAGRRVRVRERVIRGLETPFGKLDAPTDARAGFGGQGGHDFAILHAVAD